MSIYQQNIDIKCWNVDSIDTKLGSRTLSPAPTNSSGIPAAIEKLFVHPKLMRLMTRDENKLIPYSTT